jgi:insertion element IS1 protein InsB
MLTGNMPANPVRWLCLLKKRRLTIECDESWSFVGSKADEQWVWLAIDLETRLIVGRYVGPRDKTGARGLCYTDFWKAYAAILPAKRHRPVGKDTGKTAHIERVNNTLRQRCSRLVRKALSFSKTVANHIGALWYFIHDYNRRRQAELNLNTTSA